MAEKRNIFLVGPMGAGKSTIGRHLASQLHMEFLDSDTVIEERTGADIAWVFDVEGEDGFRKNTADGPCLFAALQHDVDSQYQWQTSKLEIINRLAELREEAWHV